MAKNKEIILFLQKYFFLEKFYNYSQT